MLNGRDQDVIYGVFYREKGDTEWIRYQSYRKGKSSLYNDRATARGYATYLSNYNSFGPNADKYEYECFEMHGTWYRPTESITLTEVQVKKT